MCPIKFEELTLDHVVEFSKDNTLFVAARENGNGHMRLFLIHCDTGNVYTRNGRADSWEELLGSNRDNIIVRLVDACDNHITVYHINGANGYQPA